MEYDLRATANENTQITDSAMSKSWASGKERRQKSCNFCFFVLFRSSRNVS